MYSISLVFPQQYLPSHASKAMSPAMSPAMSLAMSPANVSPVSITNLRFFYIISCKPITVYHIISKSHSNRNAIRLPQLIRALNKEILKALNIPPSSNQAGIGIFTASASQFFLVTLADCCPLMVDSYTPSIADTC
jgi:hypothetical protein